MKKAISLLLALIMVLSLVACGSTKKPRGVYASCVDLGSGWYDLGARYEIKGNKVIYTNIDGIKVERKITYDGDIISIEEETGHSDYKYDSENDVLIQQLGEMTGSFALIKVK